ncbi:ribonuclease domain-containing protein [Streptomyces sp. UNOC14_S4]|uniref:ribonuclease domain-containing protein n=1 Tax=Streptomyces sp. UNOC14_S4 TaxID=2872340 RepID=UPI001E4070C8|nr:ribonuclease domain-containing protein [Streptomyces sp. UNOC14_S4]
MNTPLLSVRVTRTAALAALASALLLGGPAVAATPTAAAHPAAHPVVAEVQAVGDICYGDLPSQAHDTITLIDQGGPFPYPRDGIVFSNREGVLPGQSSGYYHEYTVKTPGAPDRGARRVITGKRYHEDYYTADHYATFARVDFTC